MTNFDYVEVSKPKESGFDLSYSNKLTMDFGDLVPVFKQEVLPGDEIKASAQFMVRMSPLANPIFTKIDAQVHYFFVPNRILWNENKKNSWETFITGGRDGSETPVPPHFKLQQLYNSIEVDAEAGDRGVQTLSDYLGVPLMLDDYDSLQDYDYDINALPFLAYQKIYDDWFRDPNVTNSLFDTFEGLSHGGLISTTSQGFYEMIKLRNRCWKKDYFTSALPWAQRGPEVTIPVGQKFSALSDADDIDNSLITVEDSYSLNPNALGTIRDLRNANALQLWLEKNAIGGARYIEQLLAHFGVYSDDARMQRAEYLGSIKSPVVISEVQSNAETAEVPLGKLGGKGVSYGNDFAFSEKFKEHGWIIGVMSIMPEASYAQGLHRSLGARKEKLDYAFPEFAEIGLQSIDNWEINLLDKNFDEWDSTFGYNDRYGEYKSNYNEVHGLFRDSKQTLAQYNMTRFFKGTPELSERFLEVREKDITSPFVDTEMNSGNLWVDIWNDVKAIRPLPKNSLPLM